MNITEAVENSKSQHGGYREGSGRKRTRPRLSDYVTEAQILDLVQKTVEEASKTHNFDQRKWLLDQYYGKAAQSVFTEDDEGNKLPIIQVVSYVPPEN